LPGGTDFEQYEIAQKTKLHLNKLHLKDCSVNDGKKYYYKKYIKPIFLLLLKKKNQLKIAQN
jgi:hypothetical protein